MKELAWRKSSYSGGSGGNCVEVAALPGGGFAVRDSKDPNGPMLGLSAEEWRVFVHDVKAAAPGN